MPVWRDGRLHGATMDGEGFVDSLRGRFAFEVSHAHVVVLGAGGAARAGRPWPLHGRDGDNGAHRGHQAGHFRLVGREGADAQNHAVRNKVRSPQRGAERNQNQPGEHADHPTQHKQRPPSHSSLSG